MSSTKALTLSGDIVNLDLCGAKHMNESSNFDVLAYIHKETSESFVFFSPRKLSFADRESAYPAGTKV